MATKKIERGREMAEPFEFEIVLGGLFGFLQELQLFILITRSHNSSLIIFLRENVFRKLAFIRSRQRFLFLGLNSRTVKGK